MRYFFIVNPIAGHGKYQSLLSKIEAAFQARSQDVFVRVDTTKVGDAKRIAGEIAECYHNQAVVVVCGGDGTVHEVANGLAGKETPLMILPFGTGNDFAKKLFGRHFLVEQVVDNYGLLNGTSLLQRTPIDLVRVNDRYFINIMSFGFDTMVEKLGKKIAARFPFLRKWCYDLAVVIGLFRCKKFCLHVTLHTPDGVVYDHPLSFTLAAICNASYYGGGFCPAPNSKLDDGILDYCFAEPMNSLSVIRMAGAYRKGTLVGKTIHYGQTVSGTISTLDGSDLPMNCDGEHFECSSVSFQVCPQSLQLLLPKELCGKS